MSYKVTLCDYGVGNLLSVRRALEAVGAEVDQTGDPRRVAEADRLVVPGVGAFGACVETLIAHGLRDSVCAFAQSGRPLLGICVGMQMLLDSSEEFGVYEGLKIVPGSVQRIPVTRADGTPHRIPQIGWRGIWPAPEGPDWSETILAGTQPGTAFYFVHSYTAWPSDPAHRIADTDYGGRRIAAVIGKPPLYGCQFHPEKSGPAGLALLERFLSL
ncbi:MAG TPA: imidazole glycerol phosphate synthase subunit HisH [Kaistiaceae bacterium]|nr:imidazole glycerol phosphate synthase subunit HisH [Kaistiaceae bacterium]